MLNNVAEAEVIATKNQPSAQKESVVSRCRTSSIGKLITPLVPDQAEVPPARDCSFDIDADPPGVPMRPAACS